jgi:DNA-dependent RNA polymerase-like protein
MDLRSTRQATKARVRQRTSPTTAGGREREFLETPLGQRLAGPLFTPLVDFFSGKQSVKAYPAPDWLAEAIKNIRPEVLALATLAPVLHARYRGGLNEKSPLRDLKQKIGEKLDDHLRFGWDNEKRVRAGHWLLDAAILNLNCFTLGEHGIELIPGNEAELDRLRDVMFRDDPAWRPLPKPPPDWKGFRKHYDDEFGTTFISGPRDQQEKAINKAFESEFPHASALNRLKDVPLRINQAVLPLVERFGGEVVNRKRGNYKRVKGRDKKAKKLASKLARKRRAARDLVASDYNIARGLERQPFWLDYQCDFRGRVYSLQYLNYYREDHVRALFDFANGLKLGQLGLSWLEVHCANCEGSTEKKAYPARLEWIEKNKAKIKKIAANPAGSFKIWRKAEKPFQYVAACIELDAAWKDPKGFESHIPVSFDGSANGLQHLSILSLDEDAARRVNLIPSEEPQDIYTEIFRLTKAIVAADASDNVKEARWWMKRFDVLGDSKTRKIVKRPVMTYAYSATPMGMKDQILDAYEEVGDDELDYKNAWYLAKTIRNETEKLLEGPARIMKDLRDLTRHCHKENRFLKYTTTSSFPSVNAYLKSNVKKIKLRSRRGKGVVAVDHLVAVGWKPEINKIKAMNSAAPNLIHAMDAAHLVLTVNVAVEVFKINDILTVHDCYACHAAVADNLHNAIRKSLVMVHFTGMPPLESLRRENLSEGEMVTLPALDHRIITKFKNGILDSPFAWD